MIFRLIFATVVFAAGLATPLYAGVVITVDDLNLPSGQTGWIDVGIHGTAGEGITSVNLQFQLVPIGDPMSSLSFVDKTPSDLAAGVLPNPLFSFLGLSFGSLADTVTPNDTFNGAYFTFSFVPPSVPLPDATAPALLARLEVEHNIVGDPAAFIGKKFSFQVTPSTFAEDTSRLPLQSTPGTITIVSANAVPEPSSLACFTLGGLTLLATGRRRRWRKVKQA